MMTELNTGLALKKRIVYNYCLLRFADTRRLKNQISPTAYLSMAYLIVKEYLQNPSEFE